MDNIKDQIKTAYNSTRRLFIKGYVNSKGQVMDHHVEIIGYEGYRTLLRQSCDFVFNTPRPEFFSPVGWSEAVAQQTASWNNSLNGEAQRESRIELRPVEGAGYSLRSDRPDAIVLQHLKKIESKLIEGEKRSSQHRDDVTAAKAWIRETAPISQYINMLILEQGKFSSVEIAQ